MCFTDFLCVEYFSNLFRMSKSYEHSSVSSKVSHSRVNNKVSRQSRSVECDRGPFEPNECTRHAKEQDRGTAKMHWTNLFKAIGHKNLIRKSPLSRRKM